MKARERDYHYRGLIERGSRGSRLWVAGYSAVGPNGGVLFPWRTKKDCREEAKLHGFRAMFFRDGVEE